MFRSISPVAKPPLVSWRSEAIPVPDDPAHPVHLHVVEPAQEPAPGASRRLIGLMPGLHENHTTLHPLARRLVRAGLALGEYPTVFTYDMPLTGNSAYEHERKTERGAVALRAAAALLDMPVDACPHSEAWGSAVELGPGLLDSGDLHGVVGVAPAYHRDPRPASSLDVVRTAWHLIGEATRPRRLHRGGLAALSSLMVNTSQHIGHDVVGAWHEGSRLLSANLSKEAAALSQDPRIRMGVVVCEHDKITPATESHRSLEAAGFAGPIIMIQTDHGGPLLEPAWAPIIYRHLATVRPLHDS